MSFRERPGLPCSAKSRLASIEVTLELGFVVFNLIVHLRGEVVRSVVAHAELGWYSWNGSGCIALIPRSRR